MSSSVFVAEAASSLLWAWWPHSAAVLASASGHSAAVTRTRVRHAAGNSEAAEAATEDSDATEAASDREQERHRRQLDFEGGGGGVNRYVNGDGDTGDPGGEEEIEYWTMVRHSRGLQNYDLGRN